MQPFCQLRHGSRHRDHIILVHLCYTVFPYPIQRRRSSRHEIFPTKLLGAGSEEVDIAHHHPRVGVKQLPNLLSREKHHPAAGFCHNLVSWPTLPAEQIHHTDDTALTQWAICKGRLTQLRQLPCNHHAQIVLILRGIFQLAAGAKLRTKRPIKILLGQLHIGSGAQSVE